MFLDHVGLSVQSLDEQSLWYRTAFGLTEAVPFELEHVGLRGVFVIGADGFALELLERDGSSRGERASDPNSALLAQGYGHICLRVDEVDSVHARLLALGAIELMTPRHSPEPGVRMSFVADPEGNLIELLDRRGPVGS